MRHCVVGESGGGVFLCDRFGLQRADKVYFIPTRLAIRWTQVFSPTVRPCCTLTRRVSNSVAVGPWKSHNLGQTVPCAHQATTIGGHRTPPKNLVTCYENLWYPAIRR